ncbi:MAG: DUF4238 domain-containing protein [Massilimicrobiota timonensis]
MAKNIINSHWVPKVYMKEWANKYKPKEKLIKMEVSKISSLDRKIEQVFYRKECCFEDIYNFPVEDATIELNRIIEEEYLKYETQWNKLLNCVKSQKDILKNKDFIKKEILCMFYRHPAVIDTFTEINKDECIIIICEEAKKRNISDEEIQKLKEFLNQVWYLNPNIIFRKDKDLGRYENWNVCVFYSQKHEFLFADFPIIMDSKISFYDDKSHANILILPVTPNEAVVMYNPLYYNYDDCFIHNIDARKFNKQYLKNRYVKNVYAASKHALLETINIPKRNDNII